MRRLLKNLSVLFSAALLLLTFQTSWAEELNVYVDRSDPIIVVSNTRLDGNNLTVTGTAYDAWSGIQTVEASAEGAQFETVNSFEAGEGSDWTYVYQVPEDCGQYGHFVFRAVDNAGNTAEITRNDIEIYNKKAALIFPDYVIKNIAVTPEIVGEPVRAVVNVSGHGHDHEEWELTGPNFTLVWDGIIAGIEVPAGNYLLTVRTYNQTGQFTVSNMQAIVPAEDGKPGDNDRYRDTTISGTVEDISDDDAVVSGQDLVITEDSKIDDDIKTGDKVIGLGRYDTVTGEIEIRILKKTDEPARSLPDIEIDGDKKIGEIEFAGIIEAVGPDYIVVDGEVIFITENTEINCDFSELQPGDYVSGLAEIFSKSGTKALIVNKADTEKANVHIRDGMILSAAVREETVYGEPESFSGVIEDVSDMQTDGSYIVTVDGRDIALTADTLLNDAEADLSPDTVLSGIRFGNTAWTAATYGIGLMETSDAAFSGIIEKVDPQNHTLTVRGRVRNAENIDLSEFTPGMIAAGALQPGKGMISLRAVSPELDLDDIESFGGIVESVSSTDIDGIRKLSMDGDVCFITGTTYVSGDVKDGSRIAGFMDIRTRNVIAITVAEAEDHGGYMEGKIEEITSEQIQVPEKKDWYHLVLGGMYNLVGDRTVLISEGLKQGDKVSGYYYGLERKLLAVLEEDTSLMGRIRNAFLPVMIGMGVLGTAILGSGAALGIGNKKKRFSGILELESDTLILVHDPSDLENVKHYKLPKKLYETASLLNHKSVRGYTRFGKVEKLDVEK